MVSPTKGSRSRTPDGPDLFDFAAMHADAATTERPPSQQRSSSAPSARALRPSRPARTEDVVSVVSINDMPVYSDDLHSVVERALSDLPLDKVWFTYRDVKKHFGVSRATVARRIKDGLVPGIRRHQGRVLDDGAVRRFDRTQLKWLLLAVRSSGST